MKARPAPNECTSRHQSLTYCAVCAATPPRADTLRAHRQDENDAGSWDYWFGRNVVFPPAFNPTSATELAAIARHTVAYQAALRRRDDVLRELARAYERHGSELEREALGPFDPYAGAFLSPSRVLEDGETITADPLRVRQAREERQLLDALEGAEDELAEAQRILNGNKEAPPKSERGLVAFIRAGSRERGWR